jgi:hypothetical protein
MSSGGEIINTGDRSQANGKRWLYSMGYVGPFIPFCQIDLIYGPMLENRQKCGPQ